MFDHLTQWSINYQYFRDPEATEKAFQGGSFHTGDLAVMHPDGSIAILDRSKDIIISGGEVSPDALSIVRHSSLPFPKNASSLSIEQG
jgi:acyl-CoA synthetase (AMP-forming)/AMP-acid ligase II